MIFGGLFLFWMGGVTVMGLSVEEFFPEINQNLTKITWEHAVNNASFLATALENEEINMIEADIVLGTLIDSDSTDLIPVMGHPPANTSDLSLENFLTEVSNYNLDSNHTSTRKGVKLDFKSIQAFEASISIVQSFDNDTYPIWINADILEGPNTTNTTPVNATRFLSSAAAFVNSTLSIGWTTTETGAYTQENVEEMLAVIEENQVKQNITFPVRACLAAKSIDVLLNLTAEVENSTLTIWQSNETDDVDVEQLRELIQKIGLNKTYIDVPESVLKQLHLDDLPNGAVKLTGTLWFACLTALWLGFRSY